MITVRGTCQKCGGTQDIRFGKGFSRAYVEMWMGLVDGSSPLYLKPPGPESQIGQCGICGGRFRTEIVGEADDDTEEAGR